VVVLVRERDNMSLGLMVKENRYVVLSLKIFSYLGNELWSSWLEKGII